MFLFSLSSSKGFFFHTQRTKKKIGKFKINIINSGMLSQCTRIIMIFVFLYFFFLFHTQASHSVQEIYILRGNQKNYRKK